MEKNPGALRSKVVHASTLLSTNGLGWKTILRHYVEPSRHCPTERIALPTIITHPAIPLSLAIGLGPAEISKRLLVCGVAASILPDLDVLAFRLGIPYAAEWGHRGFSHSLAFAAFVAVIGACLAKSLRSTPKRVFGFLFLSAASHGILDALTNGGLGIAFLWPFSNERFFAPWHPIVVAPLSISRFLSDRGLAVLWSEFIRVWLPCLSVAIIMMIVRRYRRLGQAS